LGPQWSLWLWDSAPLFWLTLLVLSLHNAQISILLQSLFSIWLTLLVLSLHDAQISILLQSLLSVWPSLLVLSFHGAQISILLQSLLSVRVSVFAELSLQRRVRPVRLCPCASLRSVPSIRSAC